MLAALVLAWLTLCLLYWQGSWQLLYHPKTAITRTPASLILPYEPIRFAATETGTPQLTGWWIPSPNTPEASRTILYLHSADGNLSDTLEAITALHQQHLNVFAFDYRGYGQSQPARPTEKQLRQDAEWALTYLTLTRHLLAKDMVIYGSGLGANLAAELAADHSELPGVILDQPASAPMTAVFNDPRSKLVPAHWIVSDRYDLTAASSRLKIPSLWLFPQSGQIPAAYQSVVVHKTSATLILPTFQDPHYPEVLKRWLDDIPRIDQPNRLTVQ